MAGRTKPVARQPGRPASKAAAPAVVAKDAVQEAPPVLAAPPAPPPLTFTGTALRDLAIGHNQCLVALRAGERVSADRGLHAALQEMKNSVSWD